MNFFWVYDLPSWLFAVLTIAVFVIVAVGGQRLSRGLAKRLIGDEDHNDLVGHYLAAFGVFYGITLGLISVGTWENFEGVDAKVAGEAAALAATYRDVSVYPEPFRENLTTQLRDYTRAVIDEDWPLQRRGTTPHGCDKRIDDFHTLLVSYEPSTEAQKNMHAEALRQFNTWIGLRELRLQSVPAHLPSTVWKVIFIGAILNIALTWLFVAKNKLLHNLLTGLLAALLGLLIFLLAAMDNPFRGDYSVGPDVFEQVFERNMKR